ncbi:methyl-accepting chemotaxis protein [Cohnella sp. GCM10027633]|uniref:methyl-accepting chemotaxis protein n=1 Tax=unclassified Cohnella TaxID=2636738 RepID=UPI00363D5FDF
MSYRLSESIIKDKVSENAIGTITQAGGKLDNYLRTYDQLTLQLLMEPEVNGATATLFSPEATSNDRREAKKTLQEKFNPYTNADPNILAIHALSADGDKLTTVGTGNSLLMQVVADTGAKDKSWFTRAIEAGGNPVWLSTSSEGLVESSNRTSSFGIARLLQTPVSNNPIGVILIEINYEAMKAELVSLTGTQNNHVHLLDADGQYVYDDGSQPIGAKSSLALTATPTATYEAADPYGQNALIAASRSELTGWTLYGTFPVDVLVRDAKRIWTQTLLIAAVAAVLAVFISIVLVRMIGRPLVQLRNLMQLGRQGQLQSRARVGNRDELGQLADSYNGMIDNIASLVRQTSDSALHVHGRSDDILAASRRTADSAKEISQATVGIASGASTLAAQAEHGIELTQHIGVRMDDVVESNRRMGVTASEMRNVSREGAAYMSELMTKTNAAEAQTRIIAGKVKQLEGSASSILRIVELLHNLSKQTNILSLNATIEASRAGSAGRGFMVIAGEIRKLAEQSRQSLDSVGHTIERIRTEIGETAQALEEAYPTYREQIVSANHADRIFTDVHTNMDSFIGQLGSVTDSVERLKQSQASLATTMHSVSVVSQQSSAASEQVASLGMEQLSVSEGFVTLAEQLRELSASLRDTLAKFTV